MSTTTTTIAPASLRYAVAAVREEILDRGLALLPWGMLALDEAEKSLLSRDRSTWPHPADEWEGLVVGLGIAVLRLQGRGVKQPVEVVRHAIAELTSKSAA